MCKNALSPWSSCACDIERTVMEEEPKERRYLIQRPKALQYFHNGQLKKAAEKERVAGRFELFFDLLYVALVRARTRPQPRSNRFH